jgi:hypothetical protein
MTETWALADMAALQSVLETKRAPDALGLPDHIHKSLEAVAEPKSFLDTAIQRSGMRRQRGIPAGLGDWIDLADLRRLDSYTTFEGDVERVLREAWGLKQ